MKVIQVKLHVGRSRKPHAFIRAVTLTFMSLCVTRGQGLHIHGKFHTEDFFLFLSKFGFQQTASNNNQTQGYVYGNITDIFDNGLHPFLPTPQTTSVKPPTNSSEAIPHDVSKNQTLNGNLTNPRENKKLPTMKRSVPSISYPATLVVVDRSFFLDFHRLRNSRANLDTTCQLMFEEMSNGNGCSAEAKVNFKKYLRRVPCSKNGVCSEETNQTLLVYQSQLTFPIVNKNAAKFWYLSLVSCYFDEEKCQWRHSGSGNTIVEYDLWLVNGNPYMKSQNPLENQFSFDRQDTVEIYIIFFVGYLILFPIQVHAVLRQRHIVPKLFTLSVTLELVAVLSNLIHSLRFAVDGEGYAKLAVFGDISDILARAIFMLILLVLAKGWAVTRTELTSKPFIFTIWILYGIVHILLYVWNKTEVDVIEDIDEYQTWPGWLILILRTVIMMWFVYELKDTMDHEHQPHKLNFFLHFGAQALVWFIYLPIFALIALQVSTLWRSKLLLGITYSADFFAFAVMTHLLFPTRSQQYLLLTSNKFDSAVSDELEEFNEAPHVINGYTTSRRSNTRSSYDFSVQESPSLNNNVTNSNAFYNYNLNSFPEDKDSVPLIHT